MAGAASPGEESAATFDPSGKERSCPWLFASCVRFRLAAALTLCTGRYDGGRVKPPQPTASPRPNPSRPSSAATGPISPSNGSSPPAVKESAWVRNPIDRFILAELEELGWSHAPEADRVALIRRVTFDLTGLPPTPDEVAAFLGDHRPDAYERLVDRLLASPHYGERWGQHWLDLAHYADSNGFELDAERPDAWRYRDWVVTLLNADLPYDRFLMLQLAGDDVSARRSRRPDRHRLLPLRSARGRGRQRHPRGQAAVRADRDHRHGRLGLPRPDDRLRPLPRSQVRRDPHDRLLPAPGVLRRLGARPTCRSPPRPSAERFAAAEKAIDAEGRARSRSSSPRSKLPTARRSRRAS